MKTAQRTGAMVATFLRAAVIGAAGGLASIAFRAATDELQNLIVHSRNILDGARELAVWQLLAIPACGALFAALVTRYLVRGGAGTGLSDVMEAVSLRSGPLGFRSAITRALASLGIIATGGSVGREGPIISISAAASSSLTRILRAPARDRGVLLGCGVAAGFAAAYNAPIAGALFALEVVLGNFAMQLFAPVVVASVTASLVTRRLAGATTIYEVTGEPFQLESLLEVVPYLFLGVLAGFVAVGFQRLLTVGEELFEKMPGPRISKTVLGGLIIGGIAIWFPEVWGNGYEALKELIDGEGRFENFADVPWTQFAALLFILMVVKAIGTAVTVGSGGAGGVFTPSLLVGAGLGGGFGVVVHEIAPHATGPHGGYALVGMGCLVAGTTRAPIMAIMVIFELTLDYDIVLPLMLGCITASVIARAIHAPSIYTEKLMKRGVVQPSGLEETVLVTTRVADVMRTQPLTWVNQTLTYAEVVPLVTATRANVIHVCDDDRHLLGTIRVHDLIDLATMGDLGAGIIAADLMMEVDAVTGDETLASVVELYHENDVGELPVVEGDSMRLIGVVTRRDVMAALHREVLRRQNLRAKFVHREEAERSADYVELPRGVELARISALPSQHARTLGECQIRVNHGVTVVSVVRRDADGQEMRVLPDGDFVIRPGDQLIVIGSDEDLAAWRKTLDESDAS